MPLDSVSGNFDRRFAFSCIVLWLYIFGIFILAVEATNFLFLLVLLSGPLATFYLVHRFGIPQPDRSIVAEIFGREIKPDLEASIPVISELEVSSEDFEGVLMTVIAHRFAGLDAPENTLEALDLCYKNGALGIEFDLVLTKDLVPIIFHDSELDRLTSCTGEIQNKTWEELNKLDVSVNHPFHERYQDSKIPLFENVIKKAIEYDMRMFIDIKDDRQEITDIILETFQKNPVLYKRAVVSSFNFWIIYAIRKRDPNIVASMAWRPHYMCCSKYNPREEDCALYNKSVFVYYWARIIDHLTTWFFKNIAYRINGLSAVLIQKDNITPGVIDYWRQRNIRVIAWTVNTPLEKLHCVRNLGIAYMTDSMIGN